MKIIYVNHRGQQIAMSVAYNLDRKIKIGDVVPREKLWDTPWGSKAKIGKKDKKIVKIEIDEHYIFCTLK